GILRLIRSLSVPGVFDRRALRQLRTRLRRGDRAVEELGLSPEYLAGVLIAQSLPARLVIVLRGLAQVLAFSHGLRRDVVRRLRRSIRRSLDLLVALISVVSHGPSSRAFPAPRLVIDLLTRRQSELGARYLNFMPARARAGRNVNKDFKAPF